MTDSDDAFQISYAPQIGPRRRVRYQPQADGSYARIVERLRGGNWELEGRELVADVAVHTDPDDEREVVAE